MPRSLRLVAEATGFEGVTDWDTSMPDGTPQKLLDVSLIRGSSGGTSRIGLREGIISTVDWYRKNREGIRT